MTNKPATMPSLLAPSYVNHLLADDGASLFTPTAKVSKCEKKRGEKQRAKNIQFISPQSQKTTQPMLGIRGLHIASFIRIRTRLCGYSTEWLAILKFASLPRGDDAPRKNKK